MAVKALNPIAPRWYTPKSEEGSENPTRFKIRGLNGNEQGYVWPELVVDNELKTVTGMTGKGLELALRYGLVDWENFSNDQGPVAFSVQNFAFIDYGLRTELAMVIVAASYVTPEEKKT